MKGAAALVAPALLAGCIPIWSSQYQIVSSDGVAATNSKYESESLLKYRIDDITQVTLMVDASQHTGMFVAFTATVPADAKPGIDADQIQLIDCPPNKPGPLRIDYTASHVGSDGHIHYQWYVGVPDAPRKCIFKVPAFLYGDRKWMSPTVEATRGLTTPQVIDLTDLPKH